MKLRSVLPLFAADLCALRGRLSRAANQIGGRCPGRRHHRHDRALHRRADFLVENRPGAGGNLAAAAVAKSCIRRAALLVSFSSHTINATLYSTLPYDPVADFTPITMVARVTSLLVGRGDLPAKDLRALIDLAKAKPHTLTIGIGGIGSSLHLAGEKFKQMTGVDLLNVPYKGTAPALSDLLGGRSISCSSVWLLEPNRCARGNCVPME